MSKTITTIVLTISIASLIMAGLTYMQSQKEATPFAEAATLAQINHYFDRYQTWPSSDSANDPDNLRDWLGLLSTISGPYLTDINGDGLADLLYRGNANRWGLFINQGNYEMEPVYVCYFYDPTDTYYGDCADVK